MEQVLQFVQPHYSKVLECLPAPVANNLKLALGEKLDAIGLIIASVVLVLAISVLSNLKSILVKKKNLPPSIPGGWPIIGNILQLHEAKPHRTFTAWAAKHGPIFHVKTGSINNVVINSAEHAKEVMVTKYDSISTRRLPTTMRILSHNKNMVAMADSGETHRMLRKSLVGNLLGPIPLKANRPIRERALSVVIDDMFETLKGKKSEVVNVRDFIQNALFPFAMEQVFGYVPEGVHVPELGRYVDKWEIFDAMVNSVLRTVVKFDWRDLFPVLKFIPNPPVENACQTLRNKIDFIVNALIAEQRKLLKTRAPTKCFLDILLTEESHILTPLQLAMSLWEAILASADTSLVTTEWAMYELARNPQIQARLYKEIKSVVGDRIVTEDDLDKLPLLIAVVQETLRVYPPVPMLPPRYVHEEVTIGGYVIPKGWDVLVNQHGINMNPKVWSDPERWDPDRLDKSVDLGVKDFRIVPFGGGRRICAGMQQALYFVPMNIAYFVLHFEWTLPPTDPKDKALGSDDTTTFTNHKLHALKAVAKPRVHRRIGT